MLLQARIGAFEYNGVGTNTPPRIGVDPHDLVIDSEARVRAQIARFLQLDGRLVDVCGTAPCHAAGWAGP